VARLGRSFPARVKIEHQLVTAAGVQNLSPSLFTDADTFYTPVLTVGPVTLTPSLYTNTNTFYTPVISVGPVTLIPSLFVDPDTFYTAVVTRGAVNLAPSLFTDTDTFYTPSITVGPVTLTPALFTDADTFYTHVIANGLILSPPLLVDVATFYSPAVAVGAVNLAPALFASSNIFYAATITPTPSLINVHVQLNAPHIFNGALWPKDTVFSSGYLNPGELVVPDGFAYSPLMTGFSAESQAGIAQVSIEAFGRYDSHGNLLDNPPIPRPIYDAQPTPPVGDKHFLPLGNGSWP
jgi:hypothetical protein